MKGLILTLFCFVLLIFSSIPVSRGYRGKKYFFPLLYLSMAFWILYSVLFFYLPSDLGFLPGEWLVNRISLDYLNGLTLLILLSMAFSHTVFAAFMVGFSCGLLIKMLKEKETGVTLHDLIKEHGGQAEGSSVFKSRLENLVRGGYIRERAEGKFQLLPKGLFFALFTLSIQKSLNMGKGG